MFDGRNRSLSSLRSRRFSSTSRCRSSCAAWRNFTACEIMEAMIDSSRTSSRKDTPSAKRRSALSAPITSFPSFIGTQIKDMSFLLTRLRAPVLSRKSGSSEIRGTTAGWPVPTTLPVTPSPTLYLPRSLCFVDSPYAASIEISPVWRFSSVKVPRIIPMCLAMDLRTGPPTSRKSILWSSVWLISKRSESSWTSRRTLASSAVSGNVAAPVFRNQHTNPTRM